MVLGMEDGNFWHLGGVTRWNSQFLIHPWTFLAIISVASQLFLCLFWISPWLRISVYNTLASKICVKFAQASKKSDSNAQHFLSDLLTHSWFYSMLIALPSYQFPYTVMNRCLYLSAMHHVICDTLSLSTTIFLKHSDETMPLVGVCPWRDSPVTTNPKYVHKTSKGDILQKRETWQCTRVVDFAAQI
jgi:hypothetical protein